MLNERYTDKDCDGTPDFIDSTFDTVDELLEKKGIKNPLAFRYRLILLALFQIVNGIFTIL